MISDSLFEIKKYTFNSELPGSINDLRFAKDLWPIVYIISDGETRNAYVGETTDAVSRVEAHLKNSEKKELTAIHLIESEKFNKSATLDIESNLIKYISGDGQFQLLNGNLGLANHNYYQKEQVYWLMFRSIWDRLRAEGISSHSLEHIDNSDLFKYSPYKSLSTEQQRGLSMILRHLTGDQYNSLVIKGGAGTGKTILAVFLFKLLVSDLSDFNFNEIGKAEDSEIIELVRSVRKKFGKPKIALVVPMTSFRNTLKKVFSNAQGLNAKMVVGPSEITREKYDLIVVDEAHRLRRRVNITNYRSFDEGNERLGLDKETGTELDWIQMQSKQAIYFYDPNQSIKPSDVRSEDYDKLIEKPTTKSAILSSQFRVRGGNGYVDFVYNLLDANYEKLTPFHHSDYELKLFDSLPEMVEKIEEKDKQMGLCRLIAGYSWEWASKKDPKKYDIEIDGIKLRWNKTNNDWINSEGSINEVGCIHTTQGYDLNYAGVVFGHEIGFDKAKQEIVIRRENYYDKNGRNGIKDPEELKEFIVNIYKTILLRGIRGTYIYVCDPALLEYISSHIGQKEELKKQPEKAEIKLDPYINSVPLFDLNAAAGEFSDIQMVNESEYDWISIPDDIRISRDHFACKVVGESMNRVIPNGSICLFKKYSGGSRNGQIVLVQSTQIQDSDFGSGYTVKEYSSKKVVSEEGWSHSSIVLKPLSTDTTFQEIHLSEDELEDFRVIGVFEKVLS